jgi:hypothetical protein
MLNMLRLQSPYGCLEAVASLSSVSLLISSLQSLFLFRHYADSGLFSWRVQRTRHPGLLRSPFLRVYDRLFSYPAILWLFTLRVILCAAVFFLLQHRNALQGICTLIAFVSIVLSIRGPDGENGADEMTLIMFVSLSIVLASPDEWVWKCGLFFVAGQLLLAYCTSGYIRIRESTWRDGSALLVVLRQHTYGNRWFWLRARRHPGWNRWMSRTVLLYECAIPIVFFIPMKFVYFFLAFGVIFHVLNAVVMGLNTFLWAFVAAYPALLWSSAYVHEHLWKFE